MTPRGRRIWVVERKERDGTWAFQSATDYKPLMMLSYYKHQFPKISFRMCQFVPVPPRRQTRSRAKEKA